LSSMGFSLSESFAGGVDFVSSKIASLWGEVKNQGLNEGLLI
jgi:hypothetical protein